MTDIYKEIQVWEKILGEYAMLYSEKRLNIKVVEMIQKSEDAISIAEGLVLCKK